jgi:small conductance mechanosensitive channel
MEIKEEIKELVNIEQAVKLADNWLPWLMEFAVKLCVALTILIVGWLAINHIIGRLNKMLLKSTADKSFVTFVSSLVAILLKIMLIISSASQVGIQTTSFFALLGAASLAVGLALQGSLSNFAGGVLILIFRPFKIDDFIENGSISGTVESIQIFHTKLRTSDNKIIVVPNAILSNGVVINYSAEKTRRVDIVVGISYDSNIKKAKQILLSLTSTHNTLMYPEPAVYVAKLNDSSVDLSLRVWVNTENYWSTFFALNEAIKEKFDENGIIIPFKTQTLLIKNE